MNDQYFAMQTHLKGTFNGNFYYFSAVFSCVHVATVTFHSSSLSTSTIIKGNIKVKILDLHLVLLSF